MNFRYIEYDGLFPDRPYPVTVNDIFDQVTKLKESGWNPDHVIVAEPEYIGYTAIDNSDLNELIRQARDSIGE